MTPRATSARSVARCRVGDRRGRDPRVAPLFEIARSAHAGARRRIAAPPAPRRPRTTRFDVMSATGKVQVQ
jgi:hypothetical protein